MNNLNTYLEYRSQMKSGDMIEFASKTALGYLIRLFSKQRVNHTSLLISLDKYEDIKDRRFLLEALEHGVELNLLSARLRNFKGHVYWTPLNSDYDVVRQKIAAWGLERVGTEYDYKSLFANMFGAVSQDAKNFFCSEYYQMALASVGLISDKVKAVRPGEFGKFMLHEKAVKLI